MWCIFITLTPSRTWSTTVDQELAHVKNRKIPRTTPGFSVPSGWRGVLGRTTYLRLPVSTYRRPVAAILPQAVWRQTSRWCEVGSPEWLGHSGHQIGVPALVQVIPMLGSVVFDVGIVICHAVAHRRLRKVSVSNFDLCGTNLTRTLGHTQQRACTHSSTTTSSSTSSTSCTASWATPGAAASDGGGDSPPPACTPAAAATT